MNDAQANLEAAPWDYGCFAVLCVVGVIIVYMRGRRQAARRAKDTRHAIESLVRSDSDSLLYKGTFILPGGLLKHSPIRILGEGSCRLTNEGFAASGFAPRSMIPTFALALTVGLFGTLTCWAALAAVFGSAQRASGPIAAAIGLALAEAARRRSANYNSPLQLLVPWASVKKYGIWSENSNVVTVLIKGTSPSGMLHFSPDGDPDSMVADIELFASGGRRSPTRPPESTVTHPSTQRESESQLATADTSPTRIVHCPQCGTRVIPKADGRCPACQQPIQPSEG